MSAQDWPLTDEQIHDAATRGRAAGTAKLLEAGVLPPINEHNAGAFDPPLTVPEQRHRVHVEHEKPAPELCRFCAEAI